MTRIIFFFLITAFSWSQENYKTLLTKDSDTTYWVGYLNRELEKFDIKSILENRGNSFRLSTYGSMIEIQRNESEYFGSLTYFVSEVDDSRTDKRVFKRTFNIDNQIVKTLFDLLDSSRIDEIPSSKLIENYRYGFDGITYFFENKSNNQYSFKNYWSPNSQNIPEAIKIQDFIDQFYKIVGSENFSKEFSKEVPFKSYSYNGGSLVIIKPMTRKEYKEYKKRMREKKRVK